MVHLRNNNFPTVFDANLQVKQKRYSHSSVLHEFYHNEILRKLKKGNPAIKINEKISPRYLGRKFNMKL
jgi:hypothetical protein